ncbi:MAG: sugar phosphate isomerase/epimerase [Bacteroidales bacterium]|nr:sugar phosphate isomerase/epimerase [Bacteroidales bacterium]
MKLGIVLSLQPSSFSAIPFTEGVAENVDKIKKLGYDGIELAVRSPDEMDLDWLISLLKESKLPVTAIGTGQVFLEEGLSFTDPEENIRQKAIERIKSHVRMAKALDTQVIIGLVRGKRTQGIDDEKVDAWCSEALIECAMEESSVNLVVEPINRYETDIINTVGSGIELMEKVNMKNVGLLLDTFHMNIEEPSIVESILAAREHMFHFHVADSNRWYPGAGHIDFGEVLNTLSQVNYQGFVTAEILPLPEPDTAAIKAIEHMRKLEM